MTSLKTEPDADLLVGETGISSRTFSNSLDEKLYIVLPAFNEQDALPLLLRRIADVMDRMDAHYEVIVVDDGSTDDTALVASGLSFSLPARVIQHQQNQGLAGALRTGLEEAIRLASPGDVIFTLDADNTQPPPLMPRMLDMIREGHDVVIASRFQQGAQTVGVPFHRNLLSHASLLLFKLILPIPGVRDYTCGFRAYRASALAEAMRDHGDRFVSETGFSCMVDVLLKLRGRGLVMGEAPMILRYDLKPGVSKMRVLRTVRQTLSLIVRRRMGAR